MNEDNPRTDDALARLIRHGGRRQAPPPEDYELVLEAATQTLRRKAEGAKRRRAVSWLVASAAAAAGVAVMMVLPDVGQKLEVAQLHRLTGPVEMLSGRTSRWTAVDDDLNVILTGDRLRTTNESRAGIDLANGVSLRLDHGTDVTLIDADEVVLHGGRIYLDSGRYPSDSRRVAVITDAGVARDIGTQFEVRFTDESLRIRVREGRVNLSQADRELSSNAGDELLIARDGDVQRARIERDDPDWEWTQTVAPTPNLDERPVSALLEWVERETGRPVQFTKSILKLKADQTILYGSVRDVGPLAALELLLATTYFTYEILDDGTILIGEKPDAP